MGNMNNGINQIVLPSSLLPERIAVTGTTQAMLPNKLYVCTNVALTTLTLPATCSLYDIFWVIGIGAGGWRIAQNTGQSMTVGIYTTTTGTAGYVESRSNNCGLAIMNTVINTNFIQFTPPQGNVWVE